MDGQEKRASEPDDSGHSIQFVLKCMFAFPPVFFAALPLAPGERYRLLILLPLACNVMMTLVNGAVTGQHEFSSSLQSHRADDLTS